jgi:PAS domain S-box-containing protein
LKRGFAVSLDSVFPTLCINLVRLMSTETDLEKSKEDLIAEVRALRAERELSTQSNIYRKILDNIPFRISLKDISGRYVFVNKASIDASERPWEAFIGKTSHEVYDSKTSDDLEAGGAEVLRTGESILGVERMGRNIPGLVYKRDIIPFKNETGEIEYLLTASNDISNEKRAESLLRIAEEKNRKIIDASADGIITLNAKGDITTFNAAAEILFEHSAGDVIGQNIHMLLTAEMANEHSPFLWNFTHGGVPEILGKGRKMSGLRKNGESFPMDLSVSEFIDNGARAFVVIIRDVTERKNSEIGLRSALKILQETQDELIESEKMAALGGLVAGVAHEINTPLGICVTATSHLNDAIASIETAFSTRALTKNKFETFVQTAIDSMALIKNNLNRAAALVLSVRPKSS